MKYFILTVMIVEKEKDLTVSKSVDDIKTNLEMNIKSQISYGLKLVPSDSESKEVKN